MELIVHARPHVIIIVDSRFEMSHRMINLCNWYNLFYLMEKRI